MVGQKLTSSDIRGSVQRSSGVDEGGRPVKGPLGAAVIEEAAIALKTDSLRTFSQRIVSSLVADESAAFMARCTWAMISAVEGG